MKTFTYSIFNRIPVTIRSFIRIKLSHMKLASFFLSLLLISSLGLNARETQRIVHKGFDDLKIYGPRIAKPVSDLKQGPTDKRVPTSRVLRIQKNRIKRKAQRYHKIIVQIAKRNNIDPSLIKAIIMAESGYNPRAESRKGAQGLMQLMPQTAELLGVTDGFNPEENIKGGVRYFKMLLESFDGDIRLALAAYNAGSRYVREYGGVPPFSSTKIYIWKVFEYQKIYKDEMKNLPDVA